MSDTENPVSWKKRLKAFRTRRFLTREGPLSSDDLERLRQLSPLELAFAAVNPDHSADGRKAASDQLNPWGELEEEPEVIVPGFVPASRADRLEKLFFGTGHHLRKWSGAIALLAFVATFVVVGINEELKEPTLKAGLESGIISEAEFAERHRGLSDEEYEAAESAGLEFESAFPSDATLEEVLLFRIRQHPEGKKLTAAKSAGWVVIGLLMASFFTWFFTSALRRYPGRRLLLRKFNDKEVSGSLEKVITSELRPFGHIVTLSDKHIRRSRWSWIGQMIPTNFLHAAIIVIWFPLRLMLRPFNRSKHGAAYVGSARDFRNLARRLRDRIPLNLEVALTSKEAFIVRSSDDWWKHLVALLMNSSDVIVADLSNVTSGTEWELERLDRLELFRRAVLLVREDRLDHAREALAAYPVAQARELFVYNSLGSLENRAGFREAMLEAIRLKLRPESIHE